MEFDAEPLEAETHHTRDLVNEVSRDLDDRPSEGAEDLAYVSELIASCFPTAEEFVQSFAHVFRALNEVG